MERVHIHPCNRLNVKKEGDDRGFYNQWPGAVTKKRKPVEVRGTPTGGFAKP
jgi:hypothetical protein